VDSVRRPGDPEACRALAGPALEGECTAEAAYALARSGRFEDAVTACGDVKDPRWEEECWFLASDGALAQGPKALELCRRAGRFRKDCLGHAVGRHAQRIFRETPSEADAQGALEEAIETYRGEDGAQEAADLLARHLAGKDRGRPFQRATCGTASEAVCAQAFRYRVEAAARLDPDHSRQACEGELSADRVEALGLPGWAADVDGLARVAWGAVCGGE
jgi:hypothetical protein